MKWKKLGRVFAPDHQEAWLISHASNPFALPLGNGWARIYFNARDDKSRAQIAFVDMDFSAPGKRQKLSATPILLPGKVGLFDDSGVSLGCVLPVDKKFFMYYVGWNLAVTVPWRNTIGLAIADLEGQLFEKYSPAPIVERSSIDPYSMSYPFVLKDGDRYHMWYGSNLGAGREEKDMRHVIKYASSQDGIHWDRTGLIAINLIASDEYAIAKPSVLKDGNLYRMWYAYRGERYRIGYAESHDGIHWDRQDKKVGIDVSPEGWDSEMLCYPHVFDMDGHRYMLYNGNGYGKTGFGLAILE